MMLSKRRALAAEMVMLTVITGAVVLASGVVLYATSLFQVGAQQEAISVTGIKIWVHNNDANGLAWGAFSVRNSGDKVLSVVGIVVRGTDVPFAQWYADTTLTSAIIQHPMNFPGWSNNNGLLNNDTSANCSPSTTMELVLQPSSSPASDGWFCANAVAGPIVLDPNQATIIYFRVNNGTISSIDGGTAANVSVIAGKTIAKQSTTISSKT